EGMLGEHHHAHVDAALHDLRRELIEMLLREADLVAHAAGGVDGEDDVGRLVLRLRLLAHRDARTAGAPGCIVAAAGHEVADPHLAAGARAGARAVAVATAAGEAAAVAGRAAALRHARADEPQTG